MQGLSRRIVAMSRMRHRTLMTCASTCQPRVSVARTLTIGLALGVSLSAQTATAQPSSSSAREVLDRYCVTCHSERLETAGLSLEQIDVANAHEGAEIWEKVIRKLRTGAMPPVEEIGIRLVVRRAGETVFEGSTSGAQLARTFDDLIGYLARDNSFPNGVFLLTGTGIVPDHDFTLMAGDEVKIDIDGIGTLMNTVVQG